MNTHEILINTILSLENKYSKNDYCGIGIFPPIVKQYGSVPVLISAPHSVWQKREGELKYPEIYTGALTEYLAMTLRCSCITKQCFNKDLDTDDANYDDETCEYKSELIKYLSKNKCGLFVDIHGLSSKRENIIDICTNDGKNINFNECDVRLKELIDRNFKDEASINKYFKADRENVICKFVNENFYVPAIELEINAEYRKFDDRQFKMQSVRLVDCLLEWFRREIRML